MASYGGFEGILTGVTKSTDHPSGSLHVKLFYTLLRCSRRGAWNVLGSSNFHEAAEVSVEALHMSHGPFFS